MPSAMRPRTSRIAWAAVGAVATTIGIALFATGVTPWLAPAAVLFCLTIAIAQHRSWAFSIAASLVVELAALSVLVRVTSPTGLGLVAGASVVLSTLGAAAIVAFLLAPESPALRAPGLRTAAVTASAAIVVVAVLSIRGIQSGALEWAMRNDAVWNLVTTRLMVADGGLDVEANPNASPLTPGLLAVVIAVGRDRVPAAELLAHDLGRVATFWLLAAAASAMLAALIGARGARNGSRVVRFVAGAIAALIPLSWFTFGFAVQFGFYNATLTAVLLLASWLAWLEVRESRIAGAVILSLASVALLATWAPLAIVPFALGIMAMVSELVALIRRRSSWRSYVPLSLAAAPVPLYVLAVTLPDLRRDGAALAVDGGIMPLEATHVFVIVAVTAAVVALGAVQRGRGHQLTGVMIVVASGAAAAAYLVMQRVSAEASLWGYYPAKFAWLLVSLLLVILAAALASEMTAVRGRLLATAGIALVALVVPGSLMLLVPPPAGLSSVLTPVAIATSKGIAAGNPAAQRLFELAEPGLRTIAADYLDPADDRFLNSWLLQLESTSAQEPIRTYSYVLDPQNPQQVCDAVEAWGEPARVVTSSERMADDLAETCEAPGLTVEFRVPPDQRQ